MTQNLKLVLPDIDIRNRYKDSYVEAIHEGLFRTSPTEHDKHLAKTDFEAYFAERRDMNFLFVLPDGSNALRMPSTEFWLVEGDVFIGRIAIRHTLSEHLKLFGGHIGYGIRKSQRQKGYGTLILQKALPFARENLGLERVLLTCAEEAIGSIKTVERAGGVFENAVSVDISGQEVIYHRYWIAL